MTRHDENIRKIYWEECELTNRERGGDIFYIFGTKIRERGGLSGDHD
jgi:hypothetical protein